ncbi:Ira2 protein, partial [Globisporangium splendens]
MERIRSLSDLPKLHEFECAVQMEIANTNGREDAFLRNSSGLSMLFKVLGHEHGRPYFRYVLREVFGEKSTLYHKPASPSQVREYARSVIERLEKALHFAPLVLRTCCQLALKEFQKAFPESTQDMKIVIGGVLFLRILCPALIKPELLGFQPHTPRSLPAGVQIAKMLQHTLNGSLLSENHPEFAEGNVFITTFQPHVASFLVQFPQVRATLPQESPKSAEVLCVKPWDIESAPPTPNSSKLRNMSLTPSEPVKQKRRFSFRFWR